ncbi:MAG: ribokinase [Planctomycetes bacterium]|nr:ribokinase [Planctomycetota bacterium]
MRLFVIGSANIDLTFRVPSMPRPGVTEVCPYQLGFGGKGANQAVQAARLGAQVTFCGKVGDDSFGPAIVQQLRREGIATEFVSTAIGLNTGTAVILVDPTGQNSIVTHAGPNIHLTSDDVRHAASAIRNADLVLATLETPAEPLQEVLQIAKAAGVRTILNPAPPVDFSHELLKLIDLCLPNESELIALTGHPAGSIDEIRVAAKALQAKGPRRIIVTLGERGAFVLDELGDEWIKGMAVQAVDASGAGDSFAASFAVALGTGKDLREAVRWANSIAAISVTRAGTQESFPLGNSN